MARKISSVIPPDDYSEEQEELLPASSTGATDPGSNVNEINLKVQHVQEQLLDLKRQQEEVERQKKELEELSRKQKEFDEGRREIVEKVKRELEQIRIVRDSFAEHLGQTETLNPADWTSEELPTELTKALARVDQAKGVYSQSRARLTALRQAEESHASEEIPDDLAPESASYEKTFGAMVRDGFAYSALPLGLISVFLILAYLALHH